jgi:pyrimidine deaminase RibD-like protein
MAHDYESLVRNGGSTDQAAIPDISPDDHRGYMNYALKLSENSPKKPTNYRVGAVLIRLDSNEIATTGYSLELAGNTHAEQCCFIKLAKQHGLTDEEGLAGLTLPQMALYTTMEPCSERLSGNLPCVQRILRLKEFIKTVYVGILEPDKFITNNTGQRTLRDAGISVVHVPGLEKEILATATAGHQSTP